MSRYRPGHGRPRAGDGNGRRHGLKIRGPYGRVGSNPTQPIERNKYAMVI